MRTAAFILATVIAVHMGAFDFVNAWPSGAQELTAALLWAPWFLVVTRLVSLDNWREREAFELRMTAAGERNAELEVERMQSAV